jgi:hypothetical protein
MMEEIQGAEAAFGAMVQSVKANATDSGAISVTLLVPEIFAERALILARRIGWYCDCVAFMTLTAPSEDVKVAKKRHKKLPLEQKEVPPWAKPQS